MKYCRALVYYSLRIRIWLSFIVLVIFLSFVYKSAELAFSSKKIGERNDQVFAFNNETGADRFIVPNIIHFVRFNSKQISFYEYICLRAAYIRQEPEKIYIHTNLPGPDYFSGKYWDVIKRESDFWNRIQIVECELPSEVFGQKFREAWKAYHGSDVTRIRIIMQYGGIYLDNDMFVIQSLDKYRKFEITMNWDENQFLGNQVIIANKNARFLKPWLETYKVYNASVWYYNGGQRPTEEVLYKHPELLHRVKKQFGIDIAGSVRLYTDKNTKWRHLDAVHLLMSHRFYKDPHFKEIPEFNETNIQTYQYAFGDMAREILIGSPLTDLEAKI